MFISRNRHDNFPWLVSLPPDNDLLLIHIFNGKLNALQRDHPVCGIFRCQGIFKFK